MIEVNPVGLVKYQKEYNSFYRDMLASMGIPTQIASVVPYSYIGLFEITSLAGVPDDFYFSIGNPGRGNIAISSDPGERSYFHGNLSLVPYVSVINGAGIGYTSDFITAGSVPITNHRIQSRQGITEGDLEIHAEGGFNSPAQLAGGIQKSPMHFVLNGVLFSYLRKAASLVGGVNMTTRTEILFNGVRINYQ